MALYIPHSIFHLARLLVCQAGNFWSLLLTYVWALHGAVFRRVRKTSKSDHKLLHVRLFVSVLVSLSAWSSWGPTGLIFVKFDIPVLLETLSRNFKYYWNLKRITGTLHEHLVIFLWFLLKTRIVSERNLEKIKTRILCSATFTRKPCRLWDDVEKYGRAI